MSEWRVIRPGLPMHARTPLLRGFRRLHAEMTSIMSFVSTGPSVPALFRVAEIHETASGTRIPLNVPHGPAKADFVWQW